MAGCLFSSMPRSRTPFNLWKIYRNLSFTQVPVSRNISPTTYRGSAGPFFPPTCISSSTNIHFWETIKRRGIQTQPDPTNNAGEQAAPHEFASDESKSVSKSVEVLESSANDNSVKYKALSNLKTSKRHDLAMVFTCKVCETRSVKTVCRESYEKGVVVVRCGGCSNLHLIADRLGWFGEPGSVEDLLAARGEEVRKGSIDSLNLTAEDLAGLSSS
ncbi:hypothetical protein AAC387_Pa04g1094 [Persea americana]